MPGDTVLALVVGAGAVLARPWSAGLEALFYFYAAGSLVAYMMEDARATTDELFAAGATFTLLAWAFTYVFVVVQVIEPGSFMAAINPEQPRSWTELMFLSFALLSSTGNEVYLCDAATGQLQLARRKTRQVSDRCHLARMNDLWILLNRCGNYLYLTSNEFVSIIIIIKWTLHF